MPGRWHCLPFPRGMSALMGRVEGKVAFITGAARGQGRSHAVRLAEEGADIIAIDVCAPIAGMQYPSATYDDLLETVSQVEALGRQIVARQVDVRDFENLRGALDEGVASLGRLDIVSANAGITSVARATEHLLEGDWQDMMDVNLTGVWHTIKASVPHIVAGGRGGSIVITSSIAGLRPYRNLSHYATAKHGLVGLMRASALELANHSIRVNTLHPTQVDTPMIRNEATYKLFLRTGELTDERFAESSRSMHALPASWVEPIDVSNALLFLASDEARFITGVTLPIDAGAMIK
jgi:(+)-trans-carveol dehydrogenase